MSRIEVRRVVRAPRRRVWAELERIEDHVTWMADAASIRFLTPQRRGEGVRFECVTRVGPLRTVDVMEITGWRPPRTMGVRHVGLVTGEGRFELRWRGPGRTLVVWTEDLRFPGRLGGRAGARIARPVLRWIWRRNLARLAARVERPPG